MPRLLVLNGPPGIGKSTLARLYLDEHPLALALEQDVLRGLLGGWRTREVESGALARALCLVMAEAHLREGHDVVVPQFVTLPDYLDRLAQMAKSVGATHEEFLLIAGPEEAEQRFHARINDPLWAEHQAIAAEFVEAAGGYQDQYSRLILALQGRDVTAVSSSWGDPEATYRTVMDALAGRAENDR